MSTMVRQECYDAVGLYDEQLTYEDFDMWLRISRRYEFYFSPLILAKYRILPTSMSRTIHVANRWELLKSDFCIYEKHLSGDISDSLRKHLRKRLTAIGKQMYASKHARHSYYLAKVVRYDCRLHTIALLLFSLAAVPYESLSKLARVYRSFRDKLLEHGYSSTENIIQE